MDQSKSKTQSHKAINQNVNENVNDKLNESRKTLFERLATIYTQLSQLQIDTLVDELLTAMPPNRQTDVVPHESHWSEKDVVLITYGQSISNHAEPPLKTLHRFLNNWLADVVSVVHILPFYPFTSDDGFSVVDYEQVNPQLGQWSDVQAIAQDYLLMFDAVVNHISSASAWFQSYLTAQNDNNLFFVEQSPFEDLTLVTRPRTSPLLRRVDTVRGPRHVWCTFSHDQVDLNFANPNVLVAVVKVLQRYLDEGGRWFRLDAVAFLWKELGTPCINLPQTHTLIKVMRSLIEHACETAVIVTETNVPLVENLGYFGNANEAHIIYNFSLPPLLVEALLNQNSTCLKNWLMSLPALQAGTAYLNFIASHDGIGLRPAEGLLTDEQILAMKQHVKDYGGLTTDRVLPDGSVKTYEMNISLFDALKATYAGYDQLQRQRFIMAYAIAFALEGVPAVYIHSFLATPNDRQKFDATGVNRAMNRHVWDEASLNQLLADGDSDQSVIINGLKNLLQLRSLQPAFHPNAAQHIMQLPETLLGFYRVSLDQQQTIVVVYNMTSGHQPLNVNDLNLASFGRWTDIVSGQCYIGQHETIELGPYEFVWLTDSYQVIS